MLKLFAGSAIIGFYNRALTFKVGQFIFPILVAEKTQRFGILKSFFLNIFSIFGKICYVPIQILVDLNFEYCIYDYFKI